MENIKMFHIFFSHYISYFIHILEPEWVFISQVCANTQSRIKEVKKGCKCQFMLTLNPAYTGNIV